MSDAAPPPGPPPPPAFQLHRSGVPPRGAELPLPLRRLLAVLLALGVLGALYLGRYTIGLVPRPVPLPALPAVVDLIALGMTLEEVEGLAQRLPRHRGEGRFVGASGAPDREAWTFCGYPRDFPAHVILGDPPELPGVLRWSDGRVSYLRVVSPRHGPEAGTATVVGGVLEELERRLHQPAPLLLREVEARLGPGLRAGRLLEAGSPTPELDLWRWSYPWIRNGRAGELVDLDLLAEPGGRVVRLGS